MEHEICFFNSTAQGKHQEGHEPIDPRQRKQEKKREGFSPKEQRKEKTGGHRRSTYMGSGAREGRCVAARRWWQERGRPLPDQRGRERTGAIRLRGGDLGAGG